MNLIIVESPTKARTLGRFLGSSYRIMATMGHIRDLPAKELGVEVEKDFEPKYVPVAGKKKTIDELKKLAQGATKIYLATDPDREGEAIAYHTKAICENSHPPSGGPNSKFSRITFHEITKSAIEKALAQPGQINMPLVDAQQARRVLDRLVGYKLSPLLWKKIRRGLSAGRVQSVTVELVVEREREIEAFKAEEYWEIFAELARSDGSLSAGPAAGFPPGKPARGSLPGGPPTRVTRTKDNLESFSAKLVKQNDKTLKIGDGETAGKVTEELKTADYKVVAVEKKEVAQSPVPPFTTSTLQQAAARRLGFSSKRTMQVAQKLYEEGLITYHRTDSLALAAEAVDQMRAFIGKNYGEKFLPEKPRFFKTKAKVAQEAHEAVRPTDVNTKFPHFAKASRGGQIPPLRQGFEGQANSKLGSRDEERLYDLIWKRAVASQMSAAVWDQTKIRVGAKGKTNGYELLAEGKVIKFEGWLVLYGEVKNQISNIKNTDQKDKNEELATNNLLPKTKSSEADENAGLLPAVAEGESLDLISLDPLQKFTQPPARYSEATLIKELEKRGIGRPSTYAPTISTVQTRQYVEKIEGRFHPTQLGITVNDFLVKHFDKIMDYDFTAKMEDDLDEIAKGERAWVPVVREFYAPFEKKLAKVEEKAKRAKVPVETTGEKCPECGQGEVVIRSGRFGKFLSCSRFPECKYTAAYVPKLEGVKCPECGGEVVIRRTKKGKQFYGCANYPKCKWASWRKPR